MKVKWKVWFFWRLILGFKPAQAQTGLRWSTLIQTAARDKSKSSLEKSNIMGLKLFLQFFIHGTWHSIKNLSDMGYGKRLNIHRIGISEWEKKKEWKKQFYLKRIWLSGKRYQVIDPRSSLSVKKTKYKEIYIYLHCTNTTKTQRQRTLFKSNQRKKDVYFQKNRRLAVFQQKLWKSGGQFNGIFMELKQNNFQPRLLLSMRISFQNESKIKIIPVRQKLRVHFYQTEIKEILQRATIRLIADFSPETMKARKQYNDMFSMSGIEGDYQPRILHPAKLYFKSLDIHRKLTTSRPSL